MNYELIATAAFGLEAVVKREIQDLGYDILKTENGKVTFAGDERAIVRANLWLRTADRVLIKMTEFRAVTFEELFQGTKAVMWSDLIPEDGRFTVTCTTVKSRLHNEPACQSIVKKAVVEQMKTRYGVDRFKETGAEYTIKITLLKDIVTLTVDTSGTGLHKRGYRKTATKAPIKETLAAAMVQLSFWKAGRILCDPCCGSGTIPIEAALIGRNIAPGITRGFASQRWDVIPEKIWKEEKRRAYELIDYDCEIDISASDIDESAVDAALKNAEAAGVGDDISFSVKDVKDLRDDRLGGIIVTNPPYGERIGEISDIDRLYGCLKRFCRRNRTWSLFMITADPEAERKVFGRRADRRRKLYNGNIETTYYQFHGEKPGKDI